MLDLYTDLPRMLICREPPFESVPYNVSWTFWQYVFLRDPNNAEKALEVALKSAQNFIHLRGSRAGMDNNFLPYNNKYYKDWWSSVITVRTEDRIICPLPDGKNYTDYLEQICSEYLNGNLICKRKSRRKLIVSCEDAVAGAYSKAHFSEGDWGGKLSLEIEFSGLNGTLPIGAFFGVSNAKDINFWYRDHAHIYIRNTILFLNEFMPLLAGSKLGQPDRWDELGGRGFVFLDRKESGQS